MTHCTRCGEPLDDVARYANSIICSGCAFPDEMHDVEDPDRTIWNCTECWPRLCRCSDRPKGEAA